MLLKAIDKLLDWSFQKEPDYNRLNRLESDVWRQIRQSKTAQSAISFMMPVWSNKQLRYASLTLALIGGLMVSQASIQPSPRTNTLGLEVFSPNAPFLMTATFEQPEPASS
jgi:hypothetical protein